MTFQSFLYLIYRRLLSITIITFLVGGAVVSFGYSMGFMKGNNTTIFITIGAEESVSSPSLGSLYDTVQAADFFAETIQGWFKNPEFLRNVQTGTSEPLNFSVRKQEKQNLVVTVHTQQPWDSKILGSVLEHAIEEYNSVSKTSFHLAHFGRGVQSQSFPLFLFAFVGLLAGLLFSVIAAWFYEYLCGYVSDAETAENILGREAVDRICYSKVSKNLNFLAYCLQTLRQKNIVIIRMFKGAERVEHGLKDVMEGKNITTCDFPAGISELSKIKEFHAVVPVRIGKTNIAHLKKLKLIVPPDFSFIILQ